MKERRRELGKYDPFHRNGQITPPKYLRELKTKGYQLSIGSGGSDTVGALQRGSTAVAGSANSLKTKTVGARKEGRGGGVKKFQVGKAFKPQVPKNAQSR